MDTRPLGSRFLLFLSLTIFENSIRIHCGCADKEAAAGRKGLPPVGMVLASKTDDNGAHNRLDRQN